MYWELCKKLEFHQTKNCICIKQNFPRNKTRKIFWNFKIQTNTQSRLVGINKKNIICYHVNFAMLAGHREKLKVKEDEKWDKYLDHRAKVLRRQWSMEVVLVAIVVSAIGTVFKGIENIFRKGINLSVLFLVIGKIRED